MSKGYPIGPRLLKAREASGLSLSDVAGKTELSKGFLSRVERGLVSPSVDSLIAICEVVGLSMEELFAKPAYQITRASERQRAVLPGEMIIDTLLTSSTEKHVTVIETTAGPTGTGGDALYSMPTECEVCYVVSGSIEFILDGEVLLLASGDALTFNGTTPHTWHNVSATEDVRILWILAPALPNPWIKGTIVGPREIPI
ncbi:helix-turn-helix domain-containing protein [Ferrimicrobium acidiphilum]|uniref:helix-turn-helix domain-containing protein n=1 Tax=Ferrimicrobium acidiphilum TaxID=121039 RepID=UPI0023F35D0E|nr:XRE family transcriptional regulator [Ferrimicrobium acidiphilum]